MSSSEAVLAANDRFYRAFANADLTAMSAIWADEEENLTVVHPGAPVVVGRIGVFETWRVIFGEDFNVDVVCDDARAFVHGDTAIVLCTESVSGRRLTATNVFHNAAGGWRMVHHHAGPCEVPRRMSAQSKPMVH